MHPELDCVERAERRRAYGRALRVSATLDAAAVRRFVESHTGEPGCGSSR